MAELTTAEMLPEGWLRSDDDRLTDAQRAVLTGAEAVKPTEAPKPEEKAPADPSCRRCGFAEKAPPMWVKKELYPVFMDDLLLTGRFLWSFTSGNLTVQLRTLLAEEEDVCQRQGEQEGMVAVKTVTPEMAILTSYQIANRLRFTLMVAEIRVRDRVVYKAAEGSATAQDLAAIVATVDVALRAGPIRQLIQRFCQSFVDGVNAMLVEGAAPNFSLPTG